MWIPILLTLFAFANVHANIEKDLEKCVDMINLEDEDNLPEDLDEVCPSILGLFDCAEKALYKETSLTLEQIGSLLEGQKEGQLVTVAINIRNLFKELCDHDSELRKEYDADSECFKTVNANGENEECVKEADEAMNMYEEIYNTLDQEPNSDDRKCMTTAYVVACSAAQVKAKCGDRAFNTFRTIIKRSTIFKYAICSEEQMEKLKTFALEHLDTDGEDRDLLQLAFDIKRRRK